MAIQNRRGAYRDFDPTKMVEGEWAVVKDGDPNSDRGRGVYMAFGSGIVERLLTVDDMEEYTESAMTYAEEAQRQARVATEEADRAFSGTPEGYEAVVSIAQSNNLVGAEGRTGWKTIAANTDMNTLTTPDIYSASNNVAATLINSPIRTAFKLEVSYFYGNTTNRQQKIIPYAAGLQSATGTPYIEYIRRSTDSGATWNDWKLNPDLSGVVNVYGAKNLLKLTCPSQTVNGLTITVNDDGSITINGTSTASVVVTINNNLALPQDKYIISCETTGTATQASGEAAGGGFYAQNSEGTSGGTRLTSALQNGSVQVSNTVGGCWLYLGSGVTCTNFTFYPMVRHYSIVDDTYAPYAATNLELTHMARDSFNIYGAKNLLAPNRLTSTSGGVTYTYQNDGTVLLSGSGTATASQNFGQTALELPAGTYTVTGAIVSPRVAITVSHTQYAGSGEYFIGSDIGNGFTFTLAEPKVICIRIYTYANNNYDGIVAKPMLRAASISDSAYAPYAMTNAEITHRFLGIVPPAYHTTSGAGESADTIPENHYLANASYVSNLPTTSGNYWVWNFAYQVNADGTVKTGTQIATLYSNASAPWYRRQCSNGTWGDWTTMFTPS